MKQQQIVPFSCRPSIFDKVVGFIGKFPIICPLCGRFSYIHQINQNNLRESCCSHCCGSTNRQRQMAYLLCRKIGLKSLSEIKKYTGNIYNTESYGNVHNQLVKNKNYVSSEYFGEKYKSGQKVKGMIHQNLMCLSFPENSLDIVLSSDVFEHVSDPYLAHREIYRVLRPGGSHIFTVSFLSEQILDSRLNIINKIKKDSTYTHFSFEMLIELAKIGFKVQLYNLNIPTRGIIGQNSLIFSAAK